MKSRWIARVGYAVLVAALVAIGLPVWFTVRSGQFMTGPVHCKAGYESGFVRALDGPPQANLVLDVNVNPGQDTASTSYVTQEICNGTTKFVYSATMRYSYDPATGYVDLSWSAAVATHWLELCVDVWQAQTTCGPVRESQTTLAAYIGTNRTVDFVVVMGDAPSLPPGSTNRPQAPTPEPSQARELLPSTDSAK